MEKEIKPKVKTILVSQPKPETEKSPYFDMIKHYAQSGSTVIIRAFIISIVYNAIGLTLALMGILSPLLTAILMPVSSLTVIGFSMGMTSWKARHIPYMESEIWK